jgi:hydroxyacylglutathione hydrolase
VLVDCSIGGEAALRYAEESGLSIRLIVNTHGHLDHVYNNGAFKQRTGAPLAIHPADLAFLERLGEMAAAWGLPPVDSPAPDLLLHDGNKLEIGAFTLDVIHTPGHTPGSICLYGSGVLISGDTLFRESIGRTDLPGGSFPQLIESIRSRLLVLPDDTAVYPGHGPPTTIGHERRRNPFLATGGLVIE